MRKAIYLLTLLPILLCCTERTKPLKTAHNEKSNSFSLGFYNVENLFDTIDDPLTEDDEFLPHSTKAWNSDKYSQKLLKLSQAIAALGEQRPAIVGLCEVENSSVIQDLIQQPLLRDLDYQIIHYNSPDERGIDVALIYAGSRFDAVSHKVLHVEMPPGERPTRDILYVKGLIGSDLELHIFVNHWPSRYGGEEISEPKRLIAARVLKNSVDSLLAIDSKSAIICMGDFNDYPDNRSIAQLLGATAISGNGYLVDLMLELDESERGSYNYRGNWGFLDQIIVSRALVDGKLPDILLKETHPFYTSEMIYTDEKYGDEKPSRTYGGEQYYGGYSDHLPIYTVLAY